MGRTFVLGDIHGAYRALRQCLERASFDYSKDHLICLGDVADGWPDTKLCVDELLKAANLIYIFGNHDFWTLEWMETGHVEEIWRTQGGKATMNSYEKGVPESHVQLLAGSLPYYILENRLFVHAGFHPHIPLDNQSLTTFLWDRNLARTALDFHSKGIDAKLTEFDEVYIGHTPVQAKNPVKACEVWLMDTGAGWSGVLSMMNIDTKEMFVSDPVPELYPGITGRTRQ
jgi:serine/threonine protein phosphatase 1